MKAKHILLPTDFSANARNAIDYAVYLFEKVECVFHILHAFEVGPSNLSSTMGKAKDTRLFRAIKDESQRDIKSLMDELKSVNKNSLHSFNGLSIADSLVNAIGRTTIDKDVQYIFMGTKGSSALKEVFMGSNTLRVIQKIDFCPIIAVPGKYDFEAPKEIAFATNFEHIYSEVELVPLLELAKLWDSKITIVHIGIGKELHPHQQTAKDLLPKRFLDIKYGFEEIKGHKNISGAINNYTHVNDNIGMIAMVNYWHSFFEKLTNENVINRVAFNTEVPFLIFPLIEP
ncbi:universal stress protein [Arenibacter sp. M-2]|uniref:universal stress protein n=1 Tax=Arenibacter sp. M-2 TaxID=3053612 RepID=UPI002570138F|nr:universal stress protein [Arenibacter sp. M-2]MDL5512404.1 universal stress protein [Arenibacter sp. M-2]|tara:strand:- start:37007 stop:37867 length:861 start_codon:yes stop_codon:yes gene_type:complete